MYDIEKIAKEGGTGWIHGMLCDNNTAVLLVRVYQALKPENREKFELFLCEPDSFLKLVNFAWQHSPGFESGPKIRVG